MSITLENARAGRQVFNYENQRLIMRTQFKHRRYGDPMLNRLFVLTLLLCSTTVLAQQDTRTPEEKAYQYRTGVFSALEWKMGQMIAAKFGNDSAQFQRHAGDMAYLASLIEEGFVPDSIVEGSKAKAEIWQNPEDFASKAAGLQKAAGEFAQNGDIEGFNPRKFGGKHCGSCHRDYKVDD